MADINNDKWVTSGGKSIHIKSLMEDTIEDEIYDVKYENLSCDLLLIYTRHFIFDKTEANWMNILSCDLQDYFLKTIDFARCIDSADLFRKDSWGVL